MLKQESKVPSVVGLTEEKAVAMLKENKLKAEVKEIEHEGDKGKGHRAGYR